MLLAVLDLDAPSVVQIILYSYIFGGFLDSLTLRQPILVILAIHSLVVIMPGHNSVGELRPDYAVILVVAHDVL